MAGPGVPAKTPRCDRCSEPAVFCDRKSGRHLCREHFITDIEGRVAETIRSRNLIVPGDHVAIALSGGKDSTALLMILARLLPSWDSVRLSAVTVDEGIDGYREETLRCADRLVAQHGLDHACISFVELFGRTLDAFLKGREPEACSRLRGSAEEGAHCCGRKGGSDKSCHRA